MANRCGQKGFESPGLQNIDVWTWGVGLDWYVVTEVDMEWHLFQPWLPSGLAGTASGRWGRSAFGTRLWPACWTWGWSRRAEPPVPTPCLGCSHPNPKSWPLQPPYVRKGRGEGQDMEQKTINGGKGKIRHGTHTSLRKSSADPQHTQVLVENVIALLLAPRCRLWHDGCIHKRDYSGEHFNWNAP